MAGGQVRTREKTQITPEKQNRGRSQHAPGLNAIALSYSRLPKGEITPQHQQHFSAAEQTLWSSLHGYASEVQELLGERVVSQYKLGKATERFYKIVESAHNLDFPAGMLEKISFEFIDFSLDHNLDLPAYARKAAADIGLAIGNERVLEAKVRHIAEYHVTALKASWRKNPSEAQRATLSAAENMLSELGVAVDVKTGPSMLADVAQFAKEHARSMRVAGTVALISSSVMAPSVANASSNGNTEVAPPSNSSISIGLPSEGGSTDVVVGLPGSDEDGPRTINIALPSESSEFSEVPVTIDVEMDTEDVPVTVPITLPPAESALLENISDLIGIDTKQEAPEEPVVIVTPPALPDSTLGIQDIISPKDTTTPVDPITLPDKRSGLPEFDERTATVEQLAIRTIVETITVDGDVLTAAALIQHYFHDKDEVATNYKKGEPVHEPSSPVLIEDIRNLYYAFDDLIADHGHEDINYVNTSLTAYAVLDALANDQSILKSADIQQLIAGVKKPEDTYQAKLFDQYVVKAQETFAANPALLEGIKEEYRAQVEMMYAYVLMANVSDSDQAAGIQAIKDAEAAEAAKGNYANSPEAEAMQNLIDREQDPALQRTYVVFDYLMRNVGLSATQAAGIVGNLLAESAGTMDPSIEQFGGGPGRGIAQWEGGRWDALQAFAAAQGKSWDDLYVQLEFLVSEMPGRQGTLDAILGTDTVFDSANEFMVLFETPWVVVEAYETGDWSDANAQAQHRAERGQTVLDAYLAEVQAVNDARAAAEAERQAKEAVNGMTLDEAYAFMDIYNYSEDSINYIGWAAQDCNGGPLSNCVSFSTYFINKYTNFQGFWDQAPGHGVTLVWNLIERNPDVSWGYTPAPGAIFSVDGPSVYGHTGVVLGMDPYTDQIYIGEAGCSADTSWDTVHVYSLAEFSSGAYVYAYTDGRLIQDLL